MPPVPDADENECSVPMIGPRLPDPTKAIASRVMQPYRITLTMSFRPGMRPNHTIAIPTAATWPNWIVSPPGVVSLSRPPSMGREAALAIIPAINSV